MAGSDEDHSRSRRPGAEEWEWSSTCQLLGGRAIRRSSDIVCGLHRTLKMRSMSLLVEPQNQGRRFVSSLDSKPLGRFVSGLYSK
jgi:hypothetical protein